MVFHVLEAASLIVSKFFTISTVAVASEDTAKPIPAPTAAPAGPPTIRPIPAPAAVPPNAVFKILAASTPSLMESLSPEKAVARPPTVPTTPEIQPKAVKPPSAVTKSVFIEPIKLLILSLKNSIHDSSIPVSIN